MTFVICLSCLTAKIVLGFPTSFFYRAKFSKHDQNELLDKAVAGSFSKQETDFAGSHITICLDPDQLRHQTAKLRTDKELNIRRDKVYFHLFVNSLGGK